MQIAPSCSLLHTPIDLALETKLAPQIKDWLAFAAQKLEEIAVLRQGLAEGRYIISAELIANADSITHRRNSSLTNNRKIRERVKDTNADWARRDVPFAERIKVQQAILNLPPLPTTTIGSFPQTTEVRKARSAHDKGELDDAAYERSLREKTGRAIRWQEEIGPGVYDIHSPRIPATSEMEALLIKAGARLSAGQSFGSIPIAASKPAIGGDVKPALVNMVAAAKAARTALVQPA